MWSHSSSFLFHVRPGFTIWQARRASRASWKKYFFATQIASQMLNFSTIWLVGHQLTLATLHWNRNQVYSQHSRRYAGMSAILWTMLLVSPCAHYMCVRVLDTWWYYFTQNRLSRGHYSTCGYYLRKYGIPIMSIFGWPIPIMSMFWKAYSHYVIAWVNKQIITDMIPSKKMLVMEIGYPKSVHYKGGFTWGPMRPEPPLRGKKNNYYSFIIIIIEHMAPPTCLIYLLMSIAKRSLFQSLINCSDRPCNAWGQSILI